jgi:hypothetical protein
LLASETTAALLVELAGQGYWTLHSSSYAVEEARRNLERKFPESFEQYERTGTTLSLTEHHPDYRFPSGLARKDQPIFQAAMACRADYLLTGETEHNADSEAINAIVDTISALVAPPGAVFINPAHPSTSRGYLP